MTWLSWPVAVVAGAVLIPLLVLLYFLKLKRREVEISTTLLWKQTIRDMQANAPFQKLRRNLLLFLQLLLLILGLLAVAQPQLSSALKPPRRSVILIDRSASMQTADETDGSGKTITRLDKAKRDAAAYVDAMNTGGLLEDAADLLGARDPDEAMIIAFDNGAEVIQPFTSNPDLLRAAIASIAPTDDPTRIGEAVKLASAYVAPRAADDTAQAPSAIPMVLWSDGAIADLDEVRVRPEIDVIYNRLGADATPNVAITAMRAERTYDRPDEVSVFVGLQNTGAARRDVDVEFVVDGVVRSVRSVGVGARDADSGTPGVGGVVFKLDRSEVAVLSARLVTDPAWDALAADDESWFVLKPAKRLGVALVTRGNLVLRHALSGLTVSKFDEITPEDFERLAAEGKTDQYDVYVLDDWVPKDRLPGGRYLVWGAVPKLGALKAAPAEGADKPARVNAIVSWNREHPALSAIDLSAVRIAKMLKLEAGPEARVLATATGGPAIVEVTEGGVRVIDVAFSPQESNWPLDWGYVIFLAASIRTLGDDLSGVEGAVLRPGEVVSTDVPRSVGSVRLDGPGIGAVRLTPDSEGRTLFGPVNRGGIYTLRWNGEAGRTDAVVGGEVVRALAVSMQDPGESRVESRPTIDLTRGRVAAVRRDERARDHATRLWPWLMLGAAGMLIFEWWVYHRRVYL